MGRAVLYGLLLGLAVSAGQDVVDIGESKVKDSESETGCAMAYHMGAILDVAEKTCEAIKEVSACANNGKCGTFNELPSFQSQVWGNLVATFPPPFDRRISNS